MRLAQYKLPMKTKFLTLADQVEAEAQALTDASALIDASALPDPSAVAEPVTVES
jgi:hypothetical protein